MWFESVKGQLAGCELVFADSEIEYRLERVADRWKICRKLIPDLQDP